MGHLQIPPILFSMPDADVMTRQFTSMSADAELAGEDLVQCYGDRPAHRHDGGNPDPIGFGETFSTESNELPDSKSAALPRARTNVEAVMGLFAAFFIGIPVPFVATMGILNLPLRNHELVMVLATVTFLTTGYLCLTVVRLGGRAVEGERAGNSFSLNLDARANSVEPNTYDDFYVPLALAMAIRLPNWWTFLRPLIAVWWLGHFGIAALFGHLAARHLNGMNNPGLITIPITLAVTMAFLFAANLYLMLSIAVSIPLPRIWLIAWRYRFVVDFVVTVATIASA